jgi:hypothetical protein
LYTAPAGAPPKLEVDYDGDGVIDFTETSGWSKKVLKHNYHGPGVFLLVVKLTFPNGEIRTIEKVLAVEDEEKTDETLRGLWDGMSQALISGDTNKALSYIDHGARIKYEYVFTHLINRMPEIVASYSSLQKVSLSNDIGEYAINRTINGVNNIFLIYFIRDEDGIWRLSEM